jgi:AcrR family transcriptional regulator
LRPKKVEEHELLLKLMSVLRKKGYDGSSLSVLAEASGLQKASLYHRFPGGKKAITDAVLDFADVWVKNNIYDVLANSLVDPKERLKKVIRTIDHDLYDNGHEMCLLRALSMDASHGVFGHKIKKSMKMWIDAFTLLGIDFNYSKETAASKAVQVLVNIQGGLVVSESLGSTKPFQAILKSIEKLYIKT